MKRLRIPSLLCALLLIICSFAACTNGGESGATTTDISATTDKAVKTAVNISVLKGPTGMGAAYLIALNESGNTDNNYNFSIESDATVVVSDLLAGNIDIAAIPTTSAASLFNKTDGKIQILGISTLSVLYIVENGETITQIADLKGKTIVCAGQGTNVEYVLNYILKANGLTPDKDVYIEFASEHSETVTRAKAGSADIVFLPEPFATQVTSGDGGFRIAISAADEWEKAAGVELTMGVIAVRKEFAETNPDAVAKFMDEYAASVDYANGASTLSDAAALIESYEIMTSAVAEKAIPNCNIVFINGNAMVDLLNNFFEVMYDENPESIGGTIPGEDIFYLQ